MGYASGQTDSYRGFERGPQTSTDLHVPQGLSHTEKTRSSAIAEGPRDAVC